MSRKCRFSIFAVLLLLGIVSCRGSAITGKGISDLASPPEEGGKITMEWDSNTEPKLAGYRVFYGSSPGKYKSCVDVGKATEPSPGVVKFTQQVHKFLLKIVFSLAFKWPRGFSRRLEDFTAGALCPPTLTLPLGGGREGWG